MNIDSEPILRIPAWLRRPLPTAKTFSDTRGLLDGLHLHTVCKGAKCPNMHECFSSGTATFLIMGPTCTRNCRFCNIGNELPGPLDRDEPERLAKAAKEQEALLAAELAKAKEEAAKELEEKLSALAPKAKTVNAGAKAATAIGAVATGR